MFYVKGNTIEHRQIIVHETKGVLRITGGNELSKLRIMEGGA